MSDTLVEDQGTEEVSQTRSFYNRFMEQIREIDEKLDAGSEAAGKRKFTSNLVEKYEDEWKPVTDKILPQIQEMDPEKAAGAFYGLIRTLSTLKEQVDSWINQQVESQPTDTSNQVSDEEKASLSALRSDLAKKVKSIVEMAELFGDATPDNPWALPAKRGAQGKRGKRALTMFTWEVDGEPVDEDNDSVKGMSEVLGFAKSAEFTAALKEAGINTTQPEDSFTVTINGHEVSGRRLTEEDDAEEDATEVADAE